MYKEDLKQNVSKYWNVPSCETSNAQTHTEIGFLPKAGHCLLDSRFQSIRMKTRTERIYQLVNRNPGTLDSGERQYTRK